MENVTIRMLAEKLQLSTATISKALNNSHEISEETRKRVQELAKELNYVPNPYASSLRKKSSKTIAVVIPEVADSFFAEAINGIEAVAKEKGYHVLIYLTHENSQQEQAILNDFQSGRVDGILISVTMETAASEHGLAHLSKELPIVFFDRVCEELPTARVTTNDKEAAFIATRHLIERGCRNIGLLAASQQLSIIRQRISGYEKALKEAGLPLSPNAVTYYTNDTVSNYKKVCEILRQHRFDGIIATTEKLATSVYEACETLGIRMPDELKVVGFSNLSTARFLQPSLTTVAQPAFEMGKTAATLLFRSLKNNHFPLAHQQVEIPSQLVIRQSTAV
ncbi:LacI family transcriptional regulator [Chitinophaga terrae (ex Kim and Jung 2007)]|uniref:LacI family DNA-binding transcriptional regulator n=1 Tax=Chitinophaga terrae (ex Kim and Jung 2007) TaxID=408074 RepID=UPI00278AEB4F|nr:LacI family DNA-binding transcriptional regulator [Chitinophaga terrae (ex Kim and Jung 2007)]MDQ0109364.1 LacI family transcriptional regulator [Chitinophaga terrae (ex Kim and Jung 2007)]